MAHIALLLVAAAAEAVHTCHQRAIAAMCIHSTNTFVAFRLCMHSPQQFMQTEAARFAHRKRQKLVQNLRKRKKPKMQIGGGGENIEGLYTEWENPDRDEMDAFEIGDWVAVAGDNITAGLHAMFAEHVLEHFSPTQVTTVAAAAFLF